MHLIRAIINLSDKTDDIQLEILSSEKNPANAVLESMKKIMELLKGKNFNPRPKMCKITELYQFDSPLCLGISGDEKEVLSKDTSNLFEDILFKEIDGEWVKKFNDKYSMFDISDLIEKKS